MNREQRERKLIENMITAGLLSASAINLQFEEFEKMDDKSLKSFDKFIQKTFLSKKLGD